MKILTQDENHNETTQEVYAADGKLFVTRLIDSKPITLEFDAESTTYYQLEKICQMPDVLFGLLAPEVDTTEYILDQV